MESKIKVLYEDGDTLVIDKPRGFLSEDSASGSSALRVLKEERGFSFLAPINRLDREVAGVMLLAKTQKGAAFYTAALADRSKVIKEYLAVVTGAFSERSGELCDLLFKDSAKNKSFVVDRVRRGVKEAKLSYRVLDERTEEGKTLSLVHIILGTGRTHQIRVQFSHRKHPLVGDRKYGGDPLFPMGLLAYRLTFPTMKGKTLTVTSESVSETPISLFPAPF